MKSTFNKELNEIFGDIFNTVLEHESYSQYDILESDNEYRLDLYLSGAKKSDFDIKIDGDLFIVSYEGDAVKSEEGYKYHKKKQPIQPFKKTFKLSRRFDIESIDASYKDGVLKVVIPKTEEGKKKSFSIKVK